MRSQISNSRFQVRPRVARPAAVATAGGFSFVELLFAIIIMGIGFVMVAGIFPVAIRQTRLTSDETVASAGAKAFSAQVRDLVPSIRPDAPTAPGIPSALGLPVTDAVLPPSNPPPTNSPVSAFYPVNQGPTAVAALLDPPRRASDTSNPTVLKLGPGESITLPGKVFSFRDPRLFNDGPLFYRDRLWATVEGSLVSPADPRAGSVVLFSRDQTYTNPATAGGLVPIIPANVYVPGFRAAPATPIIATPSPIVRLFVIGTQSRNRTTYTLSGTVDLRRGPNDGFGTPIAPFIGMFNVGQHQKRSATLEPKPVLVATFDNPDGDGIDYIHIANITVAANPLRFLSDAPPDGPDAKAAASEGGYVILSDDGKADTLVAGYEPGKYNGRVYRLGVERSELAANADERVFELAPGDDLSSTDLEDTNNDGIPDGNTVADEEVGGSGKPGQIRDAVAWIVGQGLKDPTAAYDATSNPYTGQTQDVSVYTTFIPAKE